MPARFWGNFYYAHVIRPIADAGAGRRTADDLWRDNPGNAPDQPQSASQLICLPPDDLSLFPPSAEP